MDRQESPVAADGKLSDQHDLDAHEGAPQPLKDLFKSFRKSKAKFDDALSAEIIDFDSLGLPGLESIPYEKLDPVFQNFLGEDAKLETSHNIHDESDDSVGSNESWERELRKVRQAPLKESKRRADAYASDKIPGLVILPRLLPAEIQKTLLSRLLHRDLSNPQHTTNLHLHYDIDYPKRGESFFSCQMHDGDILPALFKPKDPEAHKILGVKHVLDKKLRWVTLGGQYDWTNKVYPKEPPPQFPPDIASLINGIFPDMVPQAAILNLYSPGDTLSMHRDISEETDRGLVSISLGCDCIFIVGLENKSTGDIQHMVVRLRSGDVLYMTGESRLAWHGVPKVIPNTCPEFLTKCPGGEFPSLSGWIRNKRINLNVRQMRESAESFSDAVPTSVQDDGFSQSTSHS